MAPTNNSSKFRQDCPSQIRIIVRTSLLDGVVLILGMSMFLYKFPNVEAVLFLQISLNQVFRKNILYKVKSPISDSS